MGCVYVIFVLLGRAYSPNPYWLLKHAEIMMMDVGRLCIRDPCVWTHCMLIVVLLVLPVVLPPNFAA